MRVVKIINRTRGTILGEKIEVADGSLTRLWGLLGRSGLDAGGGLWIKPSSGVHTMGMKFAIDVIGLDKQMKVVRLWQNLAPYRITSVHLGTCSVLELEAGRTTKCKTSLGDLIDVFPVDWKAGLTG